MAKSILEVVIKAQDKASGKINKVNKSVKTMGASSKRAGSSLAGMGAKALGAVAALSGLVVGMKKVVGLAMEQEKAEVRLAGVVKATGGAAGYTTQQLYDMAAAFQETTSMGDEMVMGGQAILLTFKNIRGEAFERTMKSALDMAAVMGTDVKAAALQLGKALNDPKTGLTMLTRVGVTFTDEQKKVILALQETGDTAGAQGVILAELESQMGGVAEALGSSLPGEVAKATAALGDLGEVIGFILKPQIIDVSRYITDASQRAGKGVTAFGEFRKAADELGYSLMDLVAAELFNRDAAEEMHEKMELVRSGIRSASAVFQFGTHHLADYGDMTKEVTEATEELQPAIQNVGLELKNRFSVALGKTSQEIVDMQTEAAALAADLKIVWDEAKAAEWVALSLEIDQVTQAFRDAAKANEEWLVTIDAQTESADRAKRQMADLYDVVVEHEEITAASTDATEQWSKIQGLAKLAAGDTTQAILDQEDEVARLTRLVEENDFQDQSLIRTWVAAQVQLGLLSDEFRENSGSVRDNTAALAENADRTERNQELKDQYALASGRATVATILLEGQIRAATEAFVAEGVASGYTAQQIANMRVQLDAATGALRGGASAANAGASALDNYTVSARAAWEAAQRLGSRGPGQVGGPPPGEYEGEGGAERFAEEQGWQVSAAGRDQEEHAKQVLGQIVAEQSGVWESGGDMSGWVKEFMMSSAGTGLAAGFDESVVNAAIQDLEIQKANAAQGLSGIVPGGYPRDSFLIGATSGEHVQITPQNMMRGAGMGGAMVINTVNVFGVQTDSQLFDAVTRVARQRGRAFARVM